MKKQEVLELIQLKLSGGDAPATVQGRYDTREISLYVSMVYDDMVNGAYERGTKTGNYDQLDNFGKAYKVLVLEDTDREEKYIELPVQIVPLPDSQGIRQVSPYKDQSQSFPYRDNNSAHVWSQLFVDQVSPGIRIYPELPRIYLVNAEETILTDVMVKLIPPFSELTDTDEVFVPGGSNTYIYEKVIELMTKPPRQDYDGSQSKQI